MTLVAISPREASIFACLADTVIAPEPALPAVRDTDAVDFFDRWLARSPTPSRLGLRALLYAAELAPLAFGFGSRLRRLERERRLEWFRSVGRTRPVQLRFLADVLKGVAQLSYYGSDGVMLRLGYDADANVARARELRAREGRP
jgi:hypothetical protein